MSKPKRKTQDGRRRRRYERSRLLVRWEHYPVNFLGFVQLAGLCIRLRQFFYRF
ncbi:MAG TPA: hypothetical protein VNF29_05735 [Candidatus Binataceae bacterium]|nr:hypothetical protein [Candidatus Binataceae bacterium]